MVVWKGADDHLSEYTFAKEASDLSKIDKVDYVFQVDRIAVQDYPKVIVVIKEVGEEAEQDLVDLEVAMLTSDLQIGKLATLHQTSGTFLHLDAVIRPDYQRRRGHAGLENENRNLKGYECEMSTDDITRF